MTFVERFIEISNWPTSRKVAILTGLILPLHLLSWLVLHFALARIKIVDIVVFDWFHSAWCAAVAFTCLISLPSTLAGKDARWTAYAFIVIYDAFIVAFTYLFGSASSVFAAALPSVILFRAVYFDERIARVSLLFELSLILAVGCLESWGVLPYAPILVERSIDAQRNEIWFAQGYYVLFLYLFVCFALLVLVIRARQLQEVRLTEAHKLIRRYVPSQIADAILAGREEKANQHERRKLTIFFSDLVGFTEIAEELEPEDLSRVLNVSRR